MWGPQTGSNALLGVFYVLSLLFGPVWRVISPMRTVYLLLGRAIPGRAARPRRSYPEAWGYRPAAVGLFAFVWMELASPESASLPLVKGWLLSYGVAMLAGAWLCGQRWLARADPFGVYSMAVSRLCPFWRNPATGKIVIGNPFDHLPSLPVRPGVVVTLAVLLGSTAFDSFSSSPTWRGFADQITREFGALQNDHALSSSALRTVGLIVFISVVAVTFSLAARATGGVDREKRRALPGQMAHSLIPIVVGLHLRALPVLPGRARPADRHRAGRSVGSRLESVGAGAPARRLCVVCAPPGAGRHQGGVRGHRAHRCGDRGP